MSDLLFLAVENAIPADHPAALLAVPIGLLFMSGSVYVLLWSNYGARKAGAIYGVAFFGFAFFIGVFWWLGGPGIPTGLGISHLPGQSGDHYAENWYGFEAGSERAEYFEDALADTGEFQPPEEFAGLAGEDEETIQTDPAFAALSGSVGQAQEVMQEQFLPVDENGVALIGSERRTTYEEDAVAAQPDDAPNRAQPFFGVEPVGEPRLLEDPQSGTLLAVQTFQATATFTDEDGIPVDPVEVGEPVDWYAFYDPGAGWFPSMLWTVLSLALFLASLFWLDRLEMREKTRELVEVEEAEDPAVPIAQ